MTPQTIAHPSFVNDLYRDIPPKNLAKNLQFLSWAARRSIKKGMNPENLSSEDILGVIVSAGYFHDASHIHIDYNRSCPKGRIMFRKKAGKITQLIDNLTEINNQEKTDELLEEIYHSCEKFHTDTGSHKENWRGFLKTDKILNPAIQKSKRDNPLESIEVMHSIFPQYGTHVIILHLRYKNTEKSEPFLNIF